MDGQDDGFLVYLSNDLKISNIEEFRDCECVCILKNGFWYKGRVLEVYSDNIVFLDIMTGKHKFSIDKIAWLSETPQGKIARLKTKKVNPAIYVLNHGGEEDGSV